MRAYFNVCESFLPGGIIVDLPSISDSSTEHLSFIFWTNENTILTFYATGQKKLFYEQ